MGGFSRVTRSCDCIGDGEDAVEMFAELVHKGSRRFKLHALLCGTGLAFGHGAFLDIKRSFVTQLGNYKGLTPGISL